MKTKLFVMLSMLATLGLIACGGDDLDAETAGQAMGEAMTSGQTAFSNVSVEMGKLDGAWVSGDASSFQVSGSLQNTTGSGSATVTGSGSKAGTGFKMDLKMVYSDWKSAQGLILNGTLNISYDVKSIGITGMDYSMKYSGDLEVSGSASGTASFDLTVTIKGMPPQVCGTVGGQDVSYGGSC
jgi:autotransporter translocation and assembly factor TamB